MGSAKRKAGKGVFLRGEDSDERRRGKRGGRGGGGGGGREKRIRRRPRPEDEVHYTELQRAVS